MSNGEDTIGLITIKPNNVRWRVFEYECCQKHFGLVTEMRPEKLEARHITNTDAKYVYWKINTEATPEILWKRCMLVASSLPPEIKHINDPRGWLACHAKEVAFDMWKRVGIPCPNWFEFTNERDFFKNFFKKCTFTYPMLLRLNNSTSGWFSYLVTNEVQVKEAIQNLEAKKGYRHDGSDNTGVGRKFIAVQFIPTTRPEKVNLSFRIIVAGNRVVTGYARIGPASDWIAITNRFEPWMEEVFIKYQKVCAEFCKTHKDMLIKSVKSLGLNIQGVDVILDKNDNPYFLEVQPGFSVGVPHTTAWRPPFYNPSKPEALVQFLIKNKERLQQEIPLYYNYWLDKYAMFDSAFTGLKEDLG